MIWVALGIGLMSSFHCVGMCGPIALAMPVIRTNTFSIITSRLLYHTGRILSYIAIGLLLGLLGNVVLLGGFQQTISIISGIFLLLFIIPYLQLEQKLSRLGTSFFNKIKKPAKYLFTQKNYGAILILGMLNGFMPCGMVYVAAAGALAAGGLINSVYFMLFFGLGTIPALYALTAGAHLLSLPIRKRMRQLIPVWIGIVALLLILRGLNLGIPYLSPQLSKPTTSTHCH